MANARVTQTETGHVVIGVPFNEITLTEDEAGKLATDILSKLGCGFEIRWPQHELHGEEKFQAQRAQRNRLIEDADAYAEGQGYDPSNAAHDDVKDAYVAGWKAAPKSVHTTIR